MQDEGAEVGFELLQQALKAPLGPLLAPNLLLVGLVPRAPLLLSPLLSAFATSLAPLLSFGLLRRWRTRSFLRGKGAGFCGGLSPCGRLTGGRNT
jgi:hypothetical protein